MLSELRCDELGHSLLSEQGKKEGLSYNDSMRVQVSEDFCSNVLVVLDVGYQYRFSTQGNTERQEKRIQVQCGT